MLITTIATIIRKIKCLIGINQKLLGKEQASVIVSIARQIYLNTNVMSLLLNHGSLLYDCNSCSSGIYVWDGDTINSPYKCRLTDDDTGILLFVDICDSCDRYIKDFQVTISDMGNRIFFRYATKDKDNPFTEWIRLR